MTQGRLARGGHLLNRATSILARAGRWVGIVMLIIIMLLVTVDVILRAAFSKPFMGSYESVQFLMVLLVFSALVCTTFAKGHIAVSVVTERLKPRARAVIYSIGYLIALALFALITWQSVMYGLRLFNSGEESLALKIPSYPFAFVIALGSAFLCLVLLANFIESLDDIGER